MRLLIRLIIFKKKVLNRLSRFFPFVDANKTVLNFIDKNFSYIAKKYAERDIETSESPHPGDGVIWLFWWQGYEAAPPLVKKCIASVHAHAGNRRVILLTEENWRNYADIPDYIIKRVERGEITLTHFSDIMRMTLLAAHGGLWLDATIFVAHDIPDVWFSKPFYTVKYSTSPSRITKGRWCGFCQSAFSHQVLHGFCRDVFFTYWQKYDALIDYFFIDYVVLYGYNAVPKIKKLIDAVPENNTGIKALDIHFSDAYSAPEYQKIINSSVFFKLNWKREYKTVRDGKETIYAHFMNT